MRIQVVFLRFVIGLVLVAALLALLFSIAFPAIEGWGATGAELTRAYPGDELLAAPTVSWTNAVTVQATPAEIWPWIIQIGDTRGGFYSYTFIENQVGSLTGAEDYKVIYHNTSVIHPEWQNPTPGDAIIQNAMNIREYNPGVYLLAEAVDPQSLGWTWLWAIRPGEERGTTRLIVRSRIQPPPGPENPVIGFMMNVGGFIMQQNMVQGIKLRSEGGYEPDWIESLEIAIWLSALLVGLIAGAGYLFRTRWQIPLIIAVAAVIVLVVLSIAQPPFWLRVVLDFGLLAGLVWSFRSPLTKTASPAPDPG